MHTYVCEPWLNRGRTDQATILVQHWFRIGSALNRYNIGSGLIRTSFCAFRGCLYTFTGYPTAFLENLELQLISQAQIGNIWKIKSWLCASFNWAWVCVSLYYARSTQYNSRTCTAFQTRGLKWPGQKIHPSKTMSTPRFRLGLSRVINIYSGSRFPMSSLHVNRIMFILTSENQNHSLNWSVEISHLSCIVTMRLTRLETEYFRVLFGCDFTYTSEGNDSW